MRGKLFSISLGGLFAAAAAWRSAQAGSCFASNSTCFPRRDALAGNFLIVQVPHVTCWFSQANQHLGQARSPRAAPFLIGMAFLLIKSKHDWYSSPSGELPAPPASAIRSAECAECRLVSAGCGLPRAAALALRRGGGLCDVCLDGRDVRRLARRRPLDGKRTRSYGAGLPQKWAERLGRRPGGATSATAIVVHHWKAI